MAGKHRATCPTHCHAIHMVYTQVVAVKAKSEAKVDAEAWAKMLDRRY